MTDVVDVEAEEVTGQELVPVDSAPSTLFHTDDPALVVKRAAETANALAAIVRDQKRELTKKIQGKEHVKVEGWTLLGTMLGVFPVCVWTRQVENGWEARVEARTKSGEVVGAAEAQCDRGESLWKNRDEYALRSMAQTRATSKALRQPLGFVMSLAGLEATPAEEMPSGGGRKVQKKQTTELAALLEKLETQAPKAEGQKSYREDVRYFVEHTFGTTDATTLTEAQFDDVIVEVKRWVKDEGLPF